MTFEDFDIFQQKLISEVLKMRDTKGREYSHSTDRFANFNRLQDSLSLPNYQIGWVYCKKHLDSLESYMKDGKCYSNETIRSRFVDAITYLTLIAGMVEEAELTRLNQMNNQMNNLIDKNNSNRVLNEEDIKIAYPNKELKDKNQGKHQPFEYDPTRKGE